MCCISIDIKTKRLHLGAVQFTALQPQIPTRFGVLGPGLGVGALVAAVALRTNDARLGGKPDLAPVTPTRSRTRGVTVAPPLKVPLALENVLMGQGHDRVLCDG